MAVRNRFEARSGSWRVTTRQLVELEKRRRRAERAARMMNEVIVPAVAKMVSYYKSRPH